MTNHLLHSRKYLTTIFSLLFLAVSLLTFPIQSIAQTRSSQRERRVQIFFAYNPTRPAAGQEIQFQDFSRGNPTSWLWDFGDGETSILQNPRHAFTTPGNYKVILTARNNISSGRVSRTLNVILSISASFTFGPSYPITGQVVQFTDTSTGGPTSWLWSFGDSTTSTSQNPSHTYTTTGSYAVTLKVGFSSGSKTVSQTITVAPSLAASFIYSPNPPVAGQAVQFTDTSTGSPTSWLWNFGDNTTSTSQNPSHTYATAGSYTVTLTVVYSSGSRSISQTITAVPPAALSASFTYSPSSPVAGQAVQFTDTSTGNPTSWLWNFGDNTTSTSKNPSHTFTAAGSYTVNLTVTNSSASKSVSHAVTVSPASTLTASFTYSPSSPAAGQVVYFSDTSTGSPTSWQWNFGDSATSTSRNPSHSYATAATYTVTLTVTNSSGSKSTSQTINILPASTLTASFTYSPSFPAIGQALQFTDTSTGSPTSWLWNFGDSATSSGQNPSHSYSAAGQYWVNLAITKGADSHSTSQMITVSQTGIVTAASPSLADVSAAIAQASPGNTVLVPAGTATWNDHIVITKGINLIGSGKDSTIIISNYYCPNQHMQPANGYSPAQCLEQYLITYKPSNPSANEPFRLSGFTLDMALKCEGIMIVNYVNSPAITNVRIDNNKITNPAVGTNSSYPWEFGVGIAMCIWGQIYGVVDNNVISGAAYFNVIGMNEYNWINETFQFGSASNLYFEDNDITLASSDTSQGCIISGAGGRWCFRYNKIHATACPQGVYPVLDAHGNMGAGGNLALMGFEAYGNTVDLGINSGRFIDQRGGRALVYNNNIIGSVNMVVREEYLDSTSPPATASDGETQHACNSYYWSNTKNTSARIDPVIGSTVNYGGSIGLVPQANRDFWFQGSSFNGTTGVGVGPLASRPATCTTGIAYWATDEGKLYVATATNVWTLYYTPYAYPHPLR